MKSLIERAVLNNIAWCALVSEIHGNTPVSNDKVWGLKSAAPTFYPDIITTDPSTTTIDVIDFLDGREVSSIKDSFAKLELVPLGYKVLFHAEWIYHPSLSFRPHVDSNWSLIHTEEQLAKWNTFSGLNSVITAPLLEREDVRFYMLEKNGQCAGFIANIGAEAVGVSNIFSTNKINGELWKKIINVVSSHFPNLPMVGYEQEEVLKATETAGWSSIGSLRIWIKEKL